MDVHPTTADVPATGADSAAAGLMTANGLQTPVARRPPLCDSSELSLSSSLLDPLLKSESEYFSLDLIAIAFGFKVTHHH